MNIGCFMDNYSNFLNCRIKSVYELFLFSGVNISPYLLSLLSQNSNAYFSVVKYKGIEIPVFSSLHPCAEKNILNKLNISYTAKSIDKIEEISDLIEEDKAVLISYDADALSRRVNKHNFGITSTTVLWQYEKPFFISTRKEEMDFLKYQEDILELSMDIETQPVAAKKEIIFLSNYHPDSTILSEEVLATAIISNLKETKERAISRESCILNSYNCIEGTDAFLKMRDALKILNQIIVLQSSKEVSRRMFILSVTIIMKIMEKNGFGFDSFYNCFWFGYQKFSQMINHKIENIENDLALVIIKKWKELYQLLLEVRNYASDNKSIDHFFKLLLNLFIDIENTEQRLFSNISIVK